MSTSTSLPLTLHAEFLPNIRQTTLYITHPAVLQPTITLSDSRRAVIVSLPAPLEDVSETIKLPARVNAESRRVLDLELNRRRQCIDGARAEDGDGRREMSFRMQIDPGEIVVQGEEITGDYVPWMAGDMGSLTRLRCRGCGNVVLDERFSKDDNANGSASTGWIWKDLPSGNWAEMMDFWHCHKPDSRDEHGHDNTHEDDHNDENFVSIQERNSEVKGYGAANRVVATSGTVLVDVATFLVAEVDCRGFKKTQNAKPDDPPASKQTSIHCVKCEALIGMEDVMVNGWRLLKANLAAYTPSEQENENQPDESTWQSHPTEIIVAAQLLELVERESARRFVVHCGQKDGLLLWVFNPSLRYSFTSPDHSITAQHAMKILYQPAPNTEALLQPESGKASSLSLEELQLPANIFAAVEQALGDSNCLLPVSARGFREWNVGVLNRFER